MSSIWRKAARKIAKEGKSGRDPVPPIVPGYVTGELLGAGAASEVWAANCVLTGEPVALKRLRDSATQQDRQRLRAEAGLLASFSHPNVIGLRGVRSDDAGLVLVLERAARSLAELLGVYGVLSAGRTVGVLAPIADALGQAHVRGILHGDISPGNILLRTDGVPLLADLGTARLMALCGGSRSPVAGSGIYGTPGFTDPALRHGEPFGAASDVYALAAVAAWALVGERLDDAPDAVQRWANRAHQLGVPPGLAAAVCAVLVSPPLNRGAADQFAAALRSACPAVALLPVEVSPPPALQIAAYEVHPDPATGARDITRQIHFTDRAAERTVAAGTPAPKRRSWLGLSRPRLLQWWAQRKQRRQHLATPRHTSRTGSYAAALASRRRRTAMVHGGVVLMLIVGAGLGGGLAITALGHNDPSTRVANRSAPRTPVEHAANHWRGVLDRLDSERARAFAVLDAKVLEGVYAPISPMLRADQAQIARLRRSGTIAMGLRHNFRAVHVFRQAGGEVLVQALEQLQVHRIVHLPAASQNESGAGAVRTVPASAPRTVQISLTLVSGKWRIDAVTPVAGEGCASHVC